MLAVRKWLAWVLDFLMKNDVDSLFNKYFFCYLYACGDMSLQIINHFYFTVCVHMLYVNICAMVAGFAQKRKSYC